MYALLVEDSIIFAEALYGLLREAGNSEVELCHVQRLAEVTSALEPIPDVVLLDLSLPDAEGLDSVRGVQHRLPGVPIVVLTADSDEERAVQMVRGGAQDYLVKGRFNVDTLIRAMRYAIERVQGDRLKRQLMQADRLAAVGRLAAGVAHEISNPATFVQANRTLLVERLRETREALDQARAAASTSPSDHLESALQRASEALEEVRQISERNATGVDRICSVVQDLRGYSRLEPGKVVRIRPNEVVNEVSSLVANLVRHKARLVKDLADVPPVALPRGRLDQILTNLMVNAAQAIPESSPQDNRVTVSTRVDGDSVVLAVEDTGPGMTPQERKKVFEPFFTTKPRGVGTGLGLPICLEIARAHGGDIQCLSADGAGTRFEVRFPGVFNPEAYTSVPPPPPAPALGCRPRVLLIDDEPHIRDVYTELLASDFDMTTANDGRQALALLRGAVRFDVIVCDVMMPDMDAAQLLEAVLQFSPQLSERFILYTGGAVSERARRLVDDGNIPVLYKPLLTNDLKSAIHKRITDVPG